MIDASAVTEKGRKKGERKKVDRPWIPNSPGSAFSYPLPAGGAGQSPGLAEPGLRPPTTQAAGGAPRNPQTPAVDALGHSPSILTGSFLAVNAWVARNNYPNVLDRVRPQLRNPTDHLDPTPKRAWRANHVAPRPRLSPGDPVGSTPAETRPGAGHRGNQTKGTGPVCNSYWCRLTLISRGGDLATGQGGVLARWGPHSARRGLGGSSN